MKYSVVLFDLDGTLLDTLDDLWASVNFALVKNGLPIRTRDEVRNFIGNGIVKLMERSVGVDRLDLVDLQLVVEDFKDHYGKHCEVKTAPYDGVLAVLRALRERGTLIGVVSNKADFAVQKLCKTYFAGLVDIAIGENEALGVKKKPAPDTLFSAIKQLQAGDDRMDVNGQTMLDAISLANVVYVGDSEVDIQTAKNAGVDCVSVTWGMKDRSFLVENGATVLVDAADELLEVL